jgi:hypothetical protein
MDQSLIEHSLAERIRERAYQIWAASGCPEGLAEQHWLAAESELRGVPRAALAAHAGLVKKSGRAPRKAKRE